ncbi:MAG: hypothetical protein HKN72_16815 [Gemmatimonadetes bacterium]|nr:hypothetical protein [Gemmatimonadota bacterium]NNF14892.1 hypothetical protein [Gemmatimonadota bacterium]
MRNPHFAMVASWREAASIVGFQPHVPEHTVGFSLGSLGVWIKDHKRRRVSQARRSLEAHYGGFVLAQSQPGMHEAANLAMETSYGPDPMPVSVEGCEGRSYQLGPPTAAGDVDGRAPAVVVWADEARFFLLASGELVVEVLLDVAGSLREANDDE